MTRPDPQGRWCLLGGEPIFLPGEAPATGARLDATFVLPPARHAPAPLTAARLATGLVVVSTLPNIARHACAAQVLDLEEHLAHAVPAASLVHVSADPAARWEEVDWFHPSLRAEAYTLDGASAADRDAFVRAFGVAVLAQRRIAHGLFALDAGRFVVVDIPREQIGTPDVARFVHRVHRHATGGRS